MLLISSSKDSLSPSEVSLDVPLHFETYTEHEIQNPTTQFGVLISLFDSIVYASVSDTLKSDVTMQSINYFISGNYYLVHILVILLTNILFTRNQ